MTDRVKYDPDLAALRDRARHLLTDRQYQAWDLVVYRGISTGETARILGVSRQAVEQRVSLAFPKLKEDREFVRLVLQSENGERGEDQGVVSPRARTDGGVAEEDRRGARCA